jgi:hypothetical protein
MSLIDDLEPVKRVDVEIAKNEAMLQEYVRGYASQVDSYIEALATHEARVNDALSRGALPPDRPVEPASAAEHQDRIAWFRDRAAMLREQRLAVIAREKPKVDLQTSAAYHDLIDQAGKPVATLKRIARQIAELQNCRHEAACAVVATDPSRGAGASRPPSPSRPDAEAVVAAVTRGVDLLDVEVDRRLGMTSNLSEIRQPPAGLEPKPGQRSVQRTHSSLGMVQPYGAGR